MEGHSRFFEAFYATGGGTAKRLAETAGATIGCGVHELCPAEVSATILPRIEAQIPTIALYIIACWGDGVFPGSAADAVALLDKKQLAGLMSYCVLGLGDRTFGSAHFNKAARELDRVLFTAGARRIRSTVLFDGAGGKQPDAMFAEWLQTTIAVMKREAERLSPVVPDVTDFAAVERDETACDETGCHLAVTDVEGSPSSSSGVGESGEAMILEPLKIALEKEGYKIVGTHSAVKVCRWTKNMIRGRGACYKHTFYGLNSTQCMEFTSSLACSNKCVFCWRHHSNPTATEWRWLVDDPAEIVDAAIPSWLSLVKPLKGVPDAVPVRLARRLRITLLQERVEESTRVKHCALSLVGEPIMYPLVNQLIRYLHAKGISTFMVTNTQQPAALEMLAPVTQLYLSIDAACPSTLQRIDRPMFPDFWDRYLECLDVLSRRKERTVLRITLVKEWNMSRDTDTPAEYARLVRLGRPCYVEVKGATYCAGGTTLSLKNTPFHSEVLSFAKELASALAPDYELACEHLHSCCVLIARVSLKREGKWHTWIDQDKFLVLSGRNAAEPQFEVQAADYSCETPEWAVFGSETRGIRPTDKKIPHK